jgi:hypothetical protein
MIFMEDQKVPEASGKVISIKKSYLLVAVLGVAAVIVGYLLLSGSVQKATYDPIAPC